MRPNIGRAILGGFVGTLAITMMMYWIGPMMGMMKMDIAASLGQFLGIGWISGMTLHLMNGTIVFPLLYVFVFHRLLPGGPALKGAAWGLILWLVAQLMVMPMMGAGIFSAKMGGMMAAGGSMVGHLIYGALLGAIAGGALRPARVSQPGVRAA
jgi:hypothetical protein